MKTDILGDPQDREEISKQFVSIEKTRDFLEWLFDYSGEIDHISQSEAWCKFEKWQEENDSKKVKETVIKVLNILEEKQDSYIDPAEHIYDSCKIIKRHLHDDDLIIYVDDLIWGLSSNTNGDFDGTLSGCIKMLKELV